MNTYLLLRDNKESGPYTAAELIDKGIKPYDLVWVEGQSAVWRYPGEILELKSYAPPPEEMTGASDHQHSPFTTAGDSSLQSPVGNEEADWVIDSALDAGLVDSSGFNEELETADPGVKNVYVNFPAHENTAATGLQEVAKPAVETINYFAPQTLRVTSSLLPEVPLVTPKEDVLDRVKRLVNETPPPPPVEPEIQFPEEPVNPRKRLYTLAGAGAFLTVLFILIYNYQKDDSRIAGIQNINEPIGSGQQTASLLTSPVEEQLTPTTEEQSVQGQNSEQALSDEKKSAEPGKSILKTDPQPTTHTRQKNEPAEELYDPAEVDALLDSDEWSMESEVKTSPSKPALSTQKPNLTPAPGPVVTQPAAERATASAIEKTPPTSSISVVTPKPATNSVQYTQTAANTSTSSPTATAAVSRPTSKRTYDSNPIVSTPVRKENPREPVNTEGINLFTLVSVKSNDYITGVLGGISNLQVQLANKSRFELYRVAVEIKYLNLDKKVVARETVYFNNVRAGEQVTLDIPKSKRGVTVDFTIRDIKT